MTHTKQQVSWALYDWANSAYATTIMAGFFPIFYKQYWAEGLSTSESTFNLGLANSIASLVVVILAPFIGTLSDTLSCKKKLLFYFAGMGIIMAACFSLVNQGAWLLACIIYTVATVSFMTSNIFYDALLIGVAQPQEREKISALGFALGYLGGGLLFTINVLMSLNPHWFGISDVTTAVKLSFLSVAIWWALFSIPIFLFVKEPPSQPLSSRSAKIALQKLYATIKQARKLKHTFLFLVAYWLYIDGVDTIIRMAVDYGLSLGFRSNTLLTALLITQFIGFPATLLFGRIGEKLGPKTGIYIGICAYIIVTLWASTMNSEYEFYALAIAIGLVQGGIQALSRALYSRLIPPHRAGEFYGLYNMLGKFSAVIGPFMVGWLGIVLDSPRLAILSIIILFVAGLTFLYFVDPNKGEIAAKEAP